MSKPQTWDELAAYLEENPLILAEGEAQPKSSYIKGNTLYHRGSASFLNHDSTLAFDQEGFSCFNWLGQKIRYTYVPNPTV